MFHCLVIKVVCLSSLCDSLFTLSYLPNLVKHFFQKFLRFSRFCLKLLFSVVLFKRLGYFIISSVICQQLIQIFWKLFCFQYFRSNSLRQLVYYTTATRNRQALFTKKSIFFYRLSLLTFSSIIFLYIFTNVNIKPIYS